MEINWLRWDIYIKNTYNSLGAAHTNKILCNPTIFRWVGGQLDGFPLLEAHGWNITFTLQKKKKKLVAHPRSDHYQTEKTPSLSAIIFPFGLMISWPFVCSKKRWKKTGHGVGCEVDVRLVYEQSHVACPCGYGLPPSTLSISRL